MEIYKLGDEVPVMGDGRSKARGSDGGLKITGMKQGVRNPNRVNVYVNGKYSFSLDVAQVVELKVKVGRELTEVELGELMRASEYGKLYQRALEWTLVRPRSVKEVREYVLKRLRTSSRGRSSRPSSRGSSLRPRSDCGCLPEDVAKPPSTVLSPHRRGCGVSSEDNLEPSTRNSSYSYDSCECSPEDVAKPPTSDTSALRRLGDEVVGRLVEKGYVDDRRFAEYFVENRFVKKGVSQKRLKMELMQKGVSKDIIEDVMGARDDTTEIKKMIARKRAKYTDEKLIAYLCRQGFSYELVRELVAESRETD